jgi:CBS domain-containing protein
LHHKPLLGFFGNIVAESGDGGSAKNFNVKEALAPIVSFARLYSLRAGLGETSTFDRIERLGREGILTQSLHDEVALAYQLLVSLRLRHQSEAIRSGLPPGNQIGIATLTRIEQTLLKEVLSQITGLQRRIASDFLGGAWTQSG